MDALPVERVLAPMKHNSRVAIIALCEDFARSVYGQDRNDAIVLRASAMLPDELDIATRAMVRWYSIQSYAASAYDDIIYAGSIARQEIDK